MPKVHAIYKPDADHADLVTACGRPSPRIGLPYKQHVESNEELEKVNCQMCRQTVQSWSSVQTWAMLKYHYEKKP